MANDRVHVANRAGAECLPEFRVHRFQRGRVELLQLLAADAGPDVLRTIMETNFFGTTETTRAFLPLLKVGTKPAIVNISSILGKRALPGRSLYSASKFAVQGFSEALRAEVAKDGIDVLIVCPGLTQTNFSQNMLEQKAFLKFDHLRGMTAEQASTLIGVNKEMGISAEQSVKEYSKFAQVLGGAMDAEGAFANGSKGVAGTLKDLGINATDAHGKGRTPHQNQSSVDL